MAIDGLIRRVPRVFDKDRGTEARESIPDISGATADLIEGAGGSSPYLADLVRKEAGWLAEAVLKSPDDALSEEIARIDAAPDQGLDAMLRTAKRRLALWIALMDLGGVWPLDRVTGALTLLADKATDRALRAAARAEIARGRLPGQTEDDLAEAGGLSVIAMGKMGAFELNYSSDIDLICLFDETRFEPDDYAEARTSFVRIVRRMTKLLSERTSDGYVFRTDLRLRPDASVTPVALSMEAAERYYESFGRTWERAAYIKARAAAGDIAAGERFLKTLTPFVWRRHLDFAAIEDAHDMRLRIRDHKGLVRPISHLGHDVKLGQGGIREIEFFTQTRQIIAGGRDPELRVRGTEEGLALLASKGWVDADHAAQLTGDYRSLRELEHRIQMVADQQTQCLPQNEAEFARIAALSDADPDAFASEITDRFRRVSDLTEPFFVPGQGAAQRAPVDTSQISQASSEVVSRWDSYPALRSKRAVEIFNRMRPALLARLGEAAKPDEAIVNFDGFLRGLPAGVQVFSLFEANPQLLDLVVDIVDTAPALGQYLARNAAVFDAVIGGGFFEAWPGGGHLREDLSASLSDIPDYEARLDRARVWQREWQFRVGVHHLRGIISAAEAGWSHAELAEATVAALWPVVVEHFSEKHGPPPGRGAVVLGMGSLGAGRLNAESDLDLIVIYDGAGEDMSEGRRPLATRAYYARLTQALVTALSAPTAEGRLYEVDMRLRPSGRQGPVATGLEAFKSYQSEEAWTWEHLALTRARPVAGSDDLGAEVEAFRRALISRDRDREETLNAVGEMRRRLAEAKPATNALDTKSGPGRILDIELLAETATLLSGAPSRRVRDQLGHAPSVLALTEDEAAELAEIYELFWTVQAAGRLMAAGPLLAEEAGAGAAAFLLQDTDIPSLDDLARRIEERAARAASLVEIAIGTRP